MNSDIKIRIATWRDAEEILAIYRPYVEDTAITFEYEVPSLNEFECRIRNVQRKYPYLVAEQDGEILGFAYADSFNERGAYGWTVEVSVYIKMDKKRLGIGKKLYEALERILIVQGVLNLNACVAYAKNEDKYLTNDSVIFHRRLDYRIAGVFHKCGYKFNRWYYVVMMEKYIGFHSENQPEVKPFNEIKTLVYEKYGIK